MQNETQQPSHERERKRARFESQDSTSSTTRRIGLVVGAMALIAAAVAVSFYTSLPEPEQGEAPLRPSQSTGSVPAPRAGGSAAASAPLLAPHGDAVRIPSSSITPRASFFKADAAGIVVPFFAVRDGSGNAVVALDACTVCAHAKRGYEQRGNEMLCKNCGMTFPVDHLARMGGQGGCHPITVPSRVDGESIVVDMRSLAAGARWFS